MKVPHWTDATDSKAGAFFRTLPETEIRRRQDLASQQIGRAYEMRTSNPAAAEAALADLNRMQDALTREMLRRSENPDQEISS